MKIKSEYLKYLIIPGIGLLMVLLSERCATIGYPSGGPRDTTPPVMVFAHPEMNSTNFKAKRIEIGFDEYVKVNNVDKELIISPPVEKKPKVWLKGKGFYFDIDRDDFIDSTTYTYNFGSSIVDLNEGNPFENFTYVFSTGPDIDSFGISGTIRNAFDLTPSKKPFWIMLYKNTEDSVPFKEKPIYVTRSTKDGFYNIDHVKAGTYRLFALREDMQNFLYDNDKEEIAFSDSLIRFNPESFIHLMETDSILPDSSAIDTLQTDTLVDNYDNFKIYRLQHNLLTFKEASTDTLQYLDDWKYIDNRMIYLSFNQPLSDSFKIVLLDSTINDNNWYVPEYSYKRDSINIWVTDTNVLLSDSIILAVRFFEHDTLRMPVLTTDTLLFLKRRKPVEKKRRKRNEEETEQVEQVEKKIYSKVSYSIKNNTKINLYDHLMINAVVPFKKIDTSKINLIRMVDTIEVPTDFYFKHDSVKLNKCHLYIDLEEDTKYKFTFLDSAFIDIYDIATDTSYLNFSTTTADQYGILYLKLSEVKGQIIVQLIDKKAKEIDRKIVNTDSEIKFEYITPGEYGIKVIYDRNKNERWDTGNYLKKILPEKVQYFPSLLKIRENWDHAESWDLDQTEN